MASQCQLCGKGKQRGHRVSHAKNRSKHTFLPNLQVRRVVKGKIKVKMFLCSRCVKKMNQEARSKNKVKESRVKES